MEEFSTVFYEIVWKKRWRCVAFIYSNIFNGIGDTIIR